MTIKVKFISVLKYLLFLSIGIGLVWWQFSKMTATEEQQFTESLEKARYIYVIPIVILGLLSHYFRALRWKLLIDPIQKVSTANTFYSVLIGYLGNTFVPRFGEILRCTMLSRYEKAPFPKLVGTVITERLFDLVCFVLFFFLTIIIQLDTVRDFVDNKLSAMASSESTVSPWLKFLVVVTICLVVYFLFRYITQKYADHRLVIRLRNLINGLKEGVSTIFRLQKRGLFLFYTVMIWALYLSQIYIGFSALDITAALGIRAAMSVLALSTIAMIVSPGGLGAFPVAVQQVLLVYHIDNISFGWLVWGVNTALIILAGLVSLVLMVWSNKRKNPESKTRDAQP